MRLKSGINYCFEIVGRASAFVTLASMGSLVLAATAIDILR